MKVKDAIEKINSGKYYSVWDAENDIDYKELVSGSSDINSHRWFIVVTRYYEMEDGFLGLTGVMETKFEMMGFEDCQVLTEAFEAEPYYITAFRPKK